jgi:ABC-type uncharacterized transport system ATPase subunit
MIVDIEKLSVDYAGIKALDGISFGIDEGDFLGIINRQILNLYYHTHYTHMIINKCVNS